MQSLGSNIASLKSARIKIQQITSTTQYSTLLHEHNSPIRTHTPHPKPQLRRQAEDLPFLDGGPQDEEVDGLDDRQRQRDEEEEHEGREEERAGDEGGEAVPGEGAVGFLYVHCAWI